MSINSASQNHPHPQGAGWTLAQNFPKKYLWVFLYLAFTSVFIYTSFSEWNYDDAYITYRYAANLASGGGFVYNPGERVLSTTTPLFTILLAASSFLWDDIPHTANVLGVLGISLGALFLWDMCQQKNLVLAGSACLVLYPTFPLLVTTIGLETPLYIAFCLGAIAIYERKQYSIAAVFSALACLTRPDGILIPIILAANYILTHRSLPPLKPVLIFSLFVLPWLVFTFLYFGTPVPAALVTKQNQGSMIVSERFGTGVLTVLRPYARRLFYISEFILGLVGMGAFLFKQKKVWSILFTWTFIYFMTYTLLGVSRYPWYYAPLVPAFVVATGLGLTVLSQFKPDNLKRNWQYLPGVLSIVMIAIFGIGQVFHVRQIKDSPDQRREIYRAVGDWLSENTLDNDLVGTLEVGIIGYHSQRPMLDFAGLLQPEIGSRLGPDTSYSDVALWATENYHPQYLVLQDQLYPSLEESYAAEFCQTVKQFPGEDYGYPGKLSIFKCSFP
ncbi:MAG: hypothetical protein A2Z16_05030 [Chloroflexi bacterium RBG_16_54_18]|nr:MAG: hypothetical protein A2Z16_05030 [Chloroflexi bacterium RBG_16_54_18]